MDVLLVFMLSDICPRVGTHCRNDCSRMDSVWAGEPGWKVLIPFYDSFICTIAFGEESKWYWFCCWFLVMASTCDMPSKTYGYSEWPSYRFLPMILSIVMVLQNAEYKSSDDPHILKQ